ncbi:MAG: ABC transporter substrate-binding protein [Burkholderiales bacterium]|nr:ABC transporter substrate-binding protein [Burkholderiales bacterium]
MRRRQALATGLALLWAPVGASAQARVRRIGYLGLATAQADAVFLDAFRAGMAALRWVEGRDYQIDARFANGVMQSGPALADDLVASAPDLLLFPAEGSGRLLAQRTKTIPIVFAFASDPVGSGFAASLRQPGGNATGLSSMAAELWPKRLQVLKESHPAGVHVGMVYAPGVEISLVQSKAIESGAATLGLRLTRLEVREAGDFEAVFKRGASLGVQAYAVTFDALTNSQRRAIAEHLLRLKAPAMFAGAQYVDDGGLMSYSASVADNFRRAAEYVDKILKGAKPGDLPVAQPTRFDLVLNLKTAKAIGLTFPQAVRLSAERTIE